MSEAQVLLVEDNSNCEELALRSLKKAGYSKVIVAVIVARDGLEALRMLLGETAPCREASFVLLDMKLPKIDGVGVLQRIRNDERTKGLRVFALSSSEDPRDREECLSLGVLAVLPKPLDAEALKQWLP